MFKATIAVLLAATVAFASASGRHVLHTRQAHPHDHMKIGRADASRTMKFTVALRQEGKDALDKIFWDRSNPDSPRYREWLSVEEVNGIIYATEEDKNAALAWLSTAADVRCKAHADALACQAPVASIEKLFSTEVHQFVGPSGPVLAQYGDYSIPAHLKDVVELVTGLSAFPVARMGKVHTSAIEPDYMVVPSTIRDFYKLGDAKGSSSSSQGVAEFQGLTAFTASDLATFIKETASDDFSVSHKVGPFQGSPPQAESTLDVQYIGSVGRGNDNWYWTEEQWMYEFAVAFSAASAKPDVVSMSYGWAENDQCAINPSVCSQHGWQSKDFVERVNTEFQKIGVQGTTLLASSGDAGAHGKTDQFCSSPKVLPNFPASSPYLLAVGATQIKGGQKGGNSPYCQQNECASGGTEIVCSHGTGALITTGGGFSEYVTAPDYQKDAIAKWKSSSAIRPPSGDWAENGRGYPDVSALGHNYYIEYNGGKVAVDGTSCSSPVFAGIIGILNAKLKAAGKSTLGFANPLMYKMASEKPESFNDITEGNNKCTEDDCCSTGFGAASGWDPTTGLGTPNYPAMADYVSSIAGLDNDSKLNLVETIAKFLRGAH